MSLMSRLLILLTLVMYSCTFIRGNLCEQELIEYIQNEENGLNFSKKLKEDFILSCTYKPAELLFKHDTSFISIQSPTIWWFKISIEHKGANEAAFLPISKILSENLMSSSLWFSARSGETNINLINVHPISYYGTKNKMDYLLAIETNNISNESIALEFNPTINELAFLQSEFEFDQKLIHKTPKLDRRC